MTDNVISLGTGRPLEQERAEVEELERRHQESLDQHAEEHRATMLGFLDNLRARVEAGDLEGLCVIGRNPASGAFLSTMLLNQRQTRVDTYLAYSGALSAMNLEMNDLAMAGPHMTPDGNFFALGAVEDIEEEED